jgi:hypothetical protein
MASEDFGQTWQTCPNHSQYDDRMNTKNPAKNNVSNAENKEITKAVAYHSSPITHHGSYHG